MDKVVTTLIRAVDRKAGMSTTEIAAAMRKAKPDFPVRAVISWRGRIRSLTIIEEYTRENESTTA